MKTVFVVDDSDVNLITAENALTDIYNVFTLSSAAAMFEFLKNIVPDLILLDIKMPDIDGFEALRMLKAKPMYINIPVIFLTGKGDSETEDLALKSGAVDFITKPFAEQKLLNCIKKYI